MLASVQQEYRPTTSGYFSAAWQQRNDQTGCHERAALAPFDLYGYWQSRFGYSRVRVW
jgi:hypothetical protein